MRLLPREEKFYGLFLRQAELIADASQLLLDGARAGNSRLAVVATEIRDLEHKADEIIHEIITRLNQTFITPLDPEDIHALSSSLDDVMDGIEDAVHRMVAYKVEPIPPIVITLAEIIRACGNVLQKAFQALEKNEKLMVHCIEINRLENEADRVHQVALQRLFDEERDPIAIIKWREVLDYLEATTDRCEDVADVLEGVVLKHA